MFYQSDFRTLPARFQPRHDNRQSLRKLRNSKVVDIDENEREKGEREDEKSLTALQVWFLDLCGNTSVHGMKFIGQTSLHWTER